MPDRTARYVTVYDLSIAPARVHGSPTTQQTPEDFRLLRNAVKSTAAAMDLLGDDADRAGRRLYLMDMEVYPRAKSVYFVWTLADPLMAAQVYMKRGKASLRPAIKDEDEDVALSAHLVIDFDVSAGVTHYPAGLEDHEGISRSRIQALLQRLLQDYMPDVVAVLDEGIEKPGRPKLIMTSHEGRPIKATDLKPMEIELIKQRPRRAMMASSGPMYYEVSERRVLKLAHDGTPATLRAAVVKFVTNLRRNYPDHRIRVRWRDPENREEPGEVTQLDPLERPERLLERALTRTEYLEGFRSLPDATNTIIARLADRMLEVVRAVAEEERPRR